MDSQHPFPLSHYLGTLAVDLGFFPLDYRAYPLQSACRAVLCGIRSLVRVSKARAPIPDPVLYPRR